MTAALGDSIGTSLRATPLVLAAQPFMAIDLRTFGRSRPYLYHLTASENLPRIRRLRRLESAATTLSASSFDAATRREWATRRRRDHLELRVDEDVVRLRDQAPLHAGNMGLEDGWTFERFVARLNGLVFFWPGGAAGPIAYGLRHFARYAEEAPAVLRARFDDVLEANPGLNPLFCRYNSGSPRWTGGRASPRGESTFREAHEASFRASEVVEVTFADVVMLPGATECGSSPQGPWSQFLTV